MKFHAILLEFWDSCCARCVDHPWRGITMSVVGYCGNTPHKMT
jgi:hypothetical protein